MRRLLFAAFAALASACSATEIITVNADDVFPLELSTGSTQELAFLPGGRVATIEGAGDEIVIANLLGGSRRVPISLDANQRLLGGAGGLVYLSDNAAFFIPTGGSATVSAGIRFPRAGAVDATGAAWVFGFDNNDAAVITIFGADGSKAGPTTLDVCVSCTDGYALARRTLYRREIAGASRRIVGFNNTGSRLASALDTIPSTWTLRALGDSALLAYLPTPDQSSFTAAHLIRLDGSGQRVSKEVLGPITTSSTRFQAHPDGFFVELLGPSTKQWLLVDKPWNWTVQREITPVSYSKRFPTILPDGSVISLFGGSVTRDVF